MEPTKIVDLDSYYEWMKVHEKKVRKKYRPKGWPIYILHQRVNNTAYAVVQRLIDVPFEELTLSLYVFCKDNTFTDFSRAYESVIEYAKVQPDKFVEQLYSFYEKQSRIIKEKGYLLRFLSFLNFFTFRSVSMNGKDNPVICAYIFLLMEQTEFLRTDKFDYNTVLAGVTTTGEVISVPDIFPNSDLAEYDLNFTSEENKMDFSAVSATYRKYGYEINSFRDMEVLISSMRMYLNAVTNLATFINEYNTDILPQTPIDSCYLHYTWPAIIPKESLIPNFMDQLMHRKRTLPANGLTVTINNSTGFDRLLLKETYHDSSVILLYKFTSNSAGDIAGFYITRDRLFYSPFDNTSGPELYNLRLKTFVLWAYTAFVCNNLEYQPTKESYLRMFQDNANIELCFSSIPGKLQRTWNPADPDGRKLTNQPDKYETQITSVAGYIRNLPAGHNASESARKLAASIGLDLESNETYVQPFLRQVWTLKEKSDT